MGTVSLSIAIAAPVPVVWAGFANEDLFGQWYTPDPDWVLDLRVFSFEVGGKRCIAFGPLGEPPYVEEDELLEIIPNEKLTFTTKMHQGDHQFSDTHCVISLKAQGGGTVLTLAETRVPDDEVAPRTDGWAGTFENLKRALADDGVPQMWTGTFKAPLARVWAAFTAAEDVQRWFTPFLGAEIDVHECGYGVGERRSITFGRGEPWEHTITETYREIEVERKCVLAVDMKMDGQSYSQITGVLQFSEPTPGTTQLELAVSDGPTVERSMRCAGWGATLANLASVL